MQWDPCAPVAGAPTKIAWSLALTFLAGCANPHAGPAALRADDPWATMPEGGATLHGWVMDDEARPVANVSVILVGTPLRNVTTANGSYAFEVAPPGWLTVAVLHSAYESASFSVHMDDGVPLRRNFTIIKLDTTAPFTELFPHTSFHRMSSCEACSWNFTTEGPPRFLLLEITGQHTIRVGNQQTQERVTLRNDTQGGDRLYNDDAPLPLRVVVENPEKAEKFRMTLACSRLWICNEERRDVWVTAFHNLDVPDDYTAQAH